MRELKWKRRMPFEEGLDSRQAGILSTKIGLAKIIREDKNGKKYITW